MTKMTLIHIGIFTAGVAAGWMLAKNQKKSFANINAMGDLRKDWNFCTNQCGYNSGGTPQGTDCLKKCMRERGNPID